ncbi:MAG: hypothetical protein JXJ04_03295 [Spirochaetales bacterium]|nr:hypothetical protein [Spirochaetales bacterium]
MEIIPKLYRKHYIDKQDERRLLFKMLADMFKIEKGLYPGSFVHITPSFYIQNMTYIDTDKRCYNFFNNENIINYVNQEKDYDKNPTINYLNIDFTKITGLEVNNYDILISLYSGFISKYCKQYLKKNGILLSNNSHGDAPLAFLDNSFRLIAVITRNGNKFFISMDDLKKYFITKNGIPIDKIKIEENLKGPGYIKTAYAYIFKKIK